MIKTDQQALNALTRYAAEHSDGRYFIKRTPTAYNVAICDDKDNVIKGAIGFNLPHAVSQIVDGQTMVEVLND